MRFVYAKNVLVFGTETSGLELPTARRKGNETKARMISRGNCQHLLAIEKVAILFIVRASLGLAVALSALPALPEGVSGTKDTKDLEAKTVVVTVSPTPSPVASVADPQLLLKKLVDLNDARKLEPGVGLVIRPDIAKFLRLTTYEIANAHQVAYKFNKSGVTISFIKWERAEDGYIFSGVKKGMIYVVRTDSNLKVIIAMKTSVEKEGQISVSPMILKDAEANEAFAGILKGWTVVLSDLNNTSR